MTDRVQRELDHGKMLAERGAESVWGWETPAGRRRAARRADLIARGAGLRLGTRALEIGCGTGNFTQAFAASGAHITAVDLSPDLIRLAKQRSLPAGQVNFVEARFEDFSTGQLFDAIIGSSVLHHLEIQDALQNLLRLLKPGGVISFAEPNMRNPQVYAMFNFEFMKDKFGVSPDERAFYRAPLAGWIHQAGFVDIHVQPFDFLHPATPKLFIPLISAAGDLAEKTPFLREYAGSLYIFARKPLV